jgi:hypothetical protein
MSQSRFNLSDMVLETERFDLRYLLTQMSDEFYPLLTPQNQSIRIEARAAKSGGSGLGLAIAKEIAAKHGGSITAQSDGGVTAFTVVLPSNKL